MMLWMVIRRNLARIWLKSNQSVTGFWSISEHSGMNTHFFEKKLAYQQIIKTPQLKVGIRYLNIFKINPWLSHGPFVSNSGSILALLYPETSTPKLWEMSKWFSSLDFLLPKCRCRWVLNFSAWAFRKRGNKSLQLEFHHLNQDSHAFVMW